MKIDKLKLLLVIGLLFSKYQALISQTIIADSLKVIYQKLDTISDSLETESLKVYRNKIGAVDDSKGMLISNKSLNRLLANETSKFMSGGNDFSFHKTYATLNDKDKRLAFFWNKPFFGNDNLLKNILGVGFKGNLIDNFSTIYDGGKFDNDFGVFINFTHLFQNGSIFFNQTKKPVVNKLRHNNADILYKNALEKYAKYRALNFDKNKLPIELINKFKVNLLNESEAKYYELELESVQEYIDKKCNTWAGLNVYFPLGKAQYDFIDSLNYKIVPKAPKINKEEFKAWEAKINYNYFCKKNNSKSYLFRTEITVSNYNNVSVLEKFEPKNLLLDKFLNTTKSQSYAFPDTSKTDYRIRKQTITTEGKKSDLYVGKYQSFTKITLNPSVLIGFQKETVLKGIRLFGDIDLQKEWRNVSFSFALPFSIERKDDKRVNLELVTSFKDLANNFNTYLRLVDRLNIGINLGLPLSEFFFK